jgi:hypothetical protein
LGNRDWAAVLPTAVLFKINDLQQGAKAFYIPFGAVFISGCVSFHTD